jgi:Ca2+-binding RTX toxin-like protein
MLSWWRLKTDVPGDDRFDLSGGAGNDAIALSPAVQKVRAAAARIDGGGGNDTLDGHSSPAEPDRPRG